MDKKKLLLHTCCAPCVVVPFERLQSDYEITCFFYNPNIHPEREYLQRLRELEKLSGVLGIGIIVQQYDSDRWFRLVKGLEQEPEGGKRCEVCFKMRLESTAKITKKQGFDIFTTTLTISPHKNATSVNQIGSDLAKQYQIEFLEANFKKKNGYRKSIELSRLYNVYRQNYCGCIFSQHEEKKLKSKN